MQIITLGMAATFYVGVTQDVLFNQSPDMVLQHGGGNSHKLLEAFVLTKKVRKRHHFKRLV
jgi:hypothetical protein